jgi:hypothetical protein
MRARAEIDVRMSAQKGGHDSVLLPGRGPDEFHTGLPSRMARAKSSPDQVA